MPSKETFVFRPRARLLQLLGDQLIGDPRVAVFELVKNAYDADSAGANVQFLSVENEKQAQIVVEDSGEGMDLETIKEDFRAGPFLHCSNTEKLIEVEISWVKEFEDDPDGNADGVGNFDFQMIIALSSGDYSGSATIVL
jgi:hypothetical protein